LARLYYYSGTGTRTVQGTLDTTGLKNSPLLSTTHWYNYEIVTLNNGGITTIRVRVWIDTMKTKPTSPGIENDSAQNLSSGLVGLVSHTGTGYRYWGPIKVVSGVQSEGAYLAFEDFKEDTVVDVKPYTPANMHPVYMVNQFTTGTDTSGFVFDKSGGVPSLVYRHKPGTEYPVTCLVAPKTNLEWRDYSYTGTIVKPAGMVYDSMWIGMDVYSSGTNRYRVMVKNDSLIIVGGSFNNYTPLDSSFDNGDTLNFKVSSYTFNGTKGAQIVPDSMSRIIVDLGVNKTTLKNYFDKYDVSMLRIKEGLPAIFIDLLGRSKTATAPIVIKNIKVKK
jgi:hypothetical protein